MARIKSEELEQEDLEQRRFLDEVMIESSDFLSFYMLQINKLARPDQSKMHFFNETLCLMINRQKLSQSRFHDLSPIQNELGLDFSLLDVMGEEEDLSPNRNFTPSTKITRSLKIDHKEITTIKTQRLQEEKKAELSKMIGHDTPITAPHTKLQGKQFLMPPEEEEHAGSDLGSVTGSDRYGSMMQRVNQAEQLNQHPSIFNLNEDSELEFDQQQFDQLKNKKKINEDINLIYDINDMNNKFLDEQLD